MVVSWATARKDDKSIRPLTAPKRICAASPTKHVITVTAINPINSSYQALMTSSPKLPNSVLELLLPAMTTPFDVVSKMKFSSRRDVSQCDIIEPAKSQVKNPMSCSTRHLRHFATSRHNLVKATNTHAAQIDKLGPVREIRNGRIVAPRVKTIKVSGPPRRPEAYLCRVPH